MHLAGVFIALAAIYLGVNKTSVLSSKSQFACNLTAHNRRTPEKTARDWL
jgi:hypothetical protein